MKDIPHHPVALLQVKLTVIRHDPRCILSTVLQDDETIVEVLNHVLEAGNSDYSAHE